MIFVVGLVLYGVIFGFLLFEYVVFQWVVEVGVVLGVFVFVGVGIVCFVFGVGQEGVGNFFDYNVFGFYGGEGVDVHGQYFGILLVEFGVGIMVVFFMFVIFYMFVGSSRFEGDE